MNLIKAQELMRDFIRSRQYHFMGWPDHSVYDNEAIEYFKLLEKDRENGIVKIDGNPETWDDYLEKTYIDCKDSPGWETLYECFDDDDREKIASFALNS